VSNEYHFVSRWRLQATAQEVADVLRDAEDLPRWWPSVYLEVRVIDEGETSGVGRVVDLWTKGWLPYTLRWRFTTLRNDGVGGLTLRADGDFVGGGTWTFIPDGDGVKAFYDWRIRAEKPLLRRLTWLMRPAFSANHRWAMRKGEESMRLELERRRLRRRASAVPSARAAVTKRHRANRSEPRSVIFLDRRTTLR
jgi:polyketide cyclase/dehydrase/lipid transport protein